MASKLYVLLFTEYEMLIDFKLFGCFDEALKEYLGYSIQETRKLLVDESDSDSKREDDESEDEEDISCKLQIFEKSVDSSELVVVKEFSIDFFLEQIANDHEDDLKEYLEKLEDIVCEDIPIPEEITKLFE